MGAWKTVRTFHLGEPYSYRGRVIPPNAIFCLKETPQGNQYWQAFWRAGGKMNSAHIGKELPFPEPEPKPTIEELMLTVSRLTEENRRLRERILELGGQELSFEPVHISTFEGVDDKLRAEAAILTVASDSKLLEVHLYPDKTYVLRYRPGKRLWKTIEREEAAKIFRRWRKGEPHYSFAKSATPERRVEVNVSATVTAQDCLEVLT